MSCEYQIQKRICKDINRWKPSDQDVYGYLNKQLYAHCKHSRAVTLKPLFNVTLW